MDIKVEQISPEEVASYEPAVRLDLGFPFKEGWKFKLAPDAQISEKDETGKRSNVKHIGTFVNIPLARLDAERFADNTSKIPHIAVECTDAPEKNAIGVRRYVQASNLYVKGSDDQPLLKMITGATEEDEFVVIERSVAASNTSASGREWAAYNLVDAKKVS